MGAGRTGRETNLDRGELSKQSPHQKRVMFYQLKLSCLFSQRYLPPQLSLILLYSCLLSFKNSNNKGSTWLDKVRKHVKIRKDEPDELPGNRTESIFPKNLGGKWFFHGKELE